MLVVSLDGGRVQTRQDKPEEKWKEDKIGVVYEATPRAERSGETYHGPPPRRRSVSTFRKKGWPIGSGIIESTVKQVGKRLKGAEKH